MVEIFDDFGEGLKERHGCAPDHPGEPGRQARLY
jgi:hypothetical protein